MAVLRCTTPFAVQEGAVPRVLRAGDLVDEKDPAVKGRENLFESVETTVERATAAPGERRSLSTPKTRRSRKDESTETPADESSATPEA
jgi:hypothetical protein